MVIIYIVYGIYSESQSFNIYLPRLAKLAIRLLVILAVYFTGFLAFKWYGLKWVTAIWQLVYFLFVLLLLLTVINDMLFEKISGEVRGVVKNLEDFFITPLFFVALFAISRALTRLNSN